MKPPCPGQRSGCPIGFALDIFGDRWSLLVMRDILLFGKQRFGELAAADEGIATNILTERLKRLEATGLIERERDPQDRRQVCYRATAKGRDLAPALLEILRWGARHDPQNRLPADFLERLETDRDGLLAEFRGERDRGG